MQAVRKIIRPNEHGQIVIDLPTDFQTDRVEVIILQYVETAPEVATAQTDLTDEQTLLLSFPVATEEDLRFTEDKRQHLNQWN